MNLVQADQILKQWAAWSWTDLQKLQPSKSRWQQECPSGWPEEPETEIPHGHDREMLKVEAAVNALRPGDAWQIIRDHYLHRRRRMTSMVDWAVRQFIGEYV